MRDDHIIFVGHFAKPAYTARTKEDPELSLVALLNKCTKKCQSNQKCNPAQPDTQHSLETTTYKTKHDKILFQSNCSSIPKPFVA